MRNVTLATVILIGGCATTGQVGLRDFNEQYGLDVPTSPKYKIDQLGKSRFQVVVYQGSILVSEATTRYTFLQKAAFIVMEDKCRRELGELRNYQTTTGIDGWGYANLLAVFSCS